MNVWLNIFRVNIRSSKSIGAARRCALDDTLITRLRDVLSAVSRSSSSSVSKNGPDMAAPITQLLHYFRCITTYLITTLQPRGHILSILGHLRYQWPWISLRGHLRSLISAPIECAYVTSYWNSIVTLVLSCRTSQILEHLYEVTYRLSIDTKIDDLGWPWRSVRSNSLGISRHF